MTKLEEQIINEIIEREGGYVNNPNDSGGATRYGITERVARANGYKGSMRYLPLELAKKIYYDKFLKPINFAEVAKHSEIIADALADIAVNMGTGRAGEFMQKSLNVFNNREKYYPDIVVDKIIGKNTLNSLEKFLQKRGRKGEEVFFNMLNVRKGCFYIELAERREKDEDFIYGWFANRIECM